jgi:hypothetical protein
MPTKQGFWFSHIVTLKAKILLVQRKPVSMVLNLWKVNEDKGYGLWCYFRSTSRRTSLVTPPIDGFRPGVGNLFMLEGRINVAVIK